MVILLIAGLCFIMLTRCLVPRAKEGGTPRSDQHPSPATAAQVCAWHVAQVVAIPPCGSQTITFVQTILHLHPSCNRVQKHPPALVVRLLTANSCWGNVLLLLLFCWGLIIIFNFKFQLHTKSELHLVLLRRQLPAKSELKYRDKCKN